MAGKTTLEERIKTLEKHMGTLIKAFKEIKFNLKALEETSDDPVSSEIKEILKSQMVIDEVIVTNSNAIKRLDKEIMQVHIKKERKIIKHSKEVEIAKQKSKRKCRYFDRGHCKYKEKCKYLHPSDICQKYVENEKCELKAKRWREQL